MNKKQLITTWAMLVLLAVGASGCALINTAIGAAAAYGIYKATQ